MMNIGPPTITQRELRSLFNDMHVTEESEKKSKVWTFEHGSFEM